MLTDLVHVSAFFRSSRNLQKPPIEDAESEDAEVEDAKVEAMEWASTLIEKFPREVSLPV